MFIDKYERPGRPTQNYTIENTRKIMQDQRKGMTYKELAEKYHLSVPTISRILRSGREKIKYGLVSEEEIYG